MPFKIHGWIWIIFIHWRTFVGSVLLVFALFAHSPVFRIRMHLYFPISCSPFLLFSAFLSVFQCCCLVVLLVFGIISFLGFYLRFFFSLNSDVMREFDITRRLTIYLNLYRDSVTFRFLFKFNAPPIKWLLQWLREPIFEVRKTSWIKWRKESFEQNLYWTYLSSCRQQLWSSANLYPVHLA